MKFAHISDVCLGTRSETPYLYDGFLNFLDYIELHPVDMIFITGDLFDHPPTKEELLFVDTQLARFPNTDVLYVTGDKDYLTEKSALWNYEFVSRTYLLNCEEIHNHVREPERAVRNSYAEGITDSLHFSKYDLDVYGICQYNSYNERNDFDSVYARNPRAINIFLGHGGDAKVCPFEPEDFGGKNFAYIGLGHKHQHTEYEKQKIYYPGSPEPVTEKDTGEHGFLYGYIDKQLTSVRFIPIAMRHFEEKQPEKQAPDYELLEELNRDNDFGRTLKALASGGEQSEETRARYADQMLTALRDITGVQSIATYTQAQIEAAATEAEADLKAEILTLRQAIAESEEKQAQFRTDLEACPDQTGTTNILHEDIGKLRFDLNKLAFEDRQVDEKYKRRRLGVILWIDTPLAIVLALLAAAGVIGFAGVVFLRLWNVWLRLIVYLIGFEIVLTALTYFLYNLTQKPRKKLFGTEIPVEAHARLRNEMQLLENRIQTLELEESARFVDQKTYNANRDALEREERRYNQLLERVEIDLRILEKLLDTHGRV